MQDVCLLWPASQKFPARIHSGWAVLIGALIPLVIFCTYYSYKRNYMKQVRFFSAVIAGLLILCAQVNAEPIGTRYFGQVVPTNATTVIFPASSNTNGATIRTLSGNATGGGQMFINANYPDGTTRTILFVVSWVGVAPMLVLPYPIDLPANVGLSITMQYGSLAGQAYATYDFK